MSVRFRFRSALALPIVIPALAAVQIAACAGGEDGSTSAGSTSTGVQTGTGGQGGTNVGGSNTGGSNTGGMSSGDGGSGGNTGCKNDNDCGKDPTGPICDTGTGECVGCLPQEDKCLAGQYCNPTIKQCEVGCTDDTDCTQGSDQNCDVPTHKCVGCVTDTNCNPGSICISDTCVPGCSDSQPCQAGFSCCSSTCYDLSNNEGHCGDCTTICSKPAHAAPFCENGACGMGACEGVWADCDKNPENGCEWNTLQDGPCTCTPDEVQNCYFGAPGTMNIGPCKAGTQVCQPDGLSWSPCLGQVMPASEICANNVDDDCDGLKDNATDADGDGWSTCNGDCCDTSAGCGDPTLVNPGAVEFLNDGIDNDCNPTTSDTKQVVCGIATKFTDVTGADVAMAMELCQNTTANPPLPDKRWGVISTSQTHADGSIPSVAALNNIQDYQTAIITEYGTGGVIPKNGPTMAGISTGRMRDQNDPGYVAPNGGTSFNVTGTPPGAYLAAHNNKLPSQIDCKNTTCDAGTGANDSLDIKMKVRVPTNAKSFSYDFRFFSAEYQGYTCSIYNDFFITLLETTAQGIPADKNISFDALKNPISVNNGFFDVCVPKGCYTCPGGSAALQGTGMQISNTGGATNWLTTEAPVVAGETITLDLVLFDVTDNLIDSLVLLDNFRWNPYPPNCATPPCTHE